MSEITSTSETTDSSGGSGSRHLDAATRWETPEFPPQNTGTASSVGMSIQELEQLQKQAFEEAYAIGIEQGIKAGAEKAQQETQRLTALFEQLDRPFDALDESVEQQIAQLAMIIARHVIRRELKTEPTHVIGAVREALQALPVSARNVRVKLHPKDAELVRKHLQPAEGEQAWEIEEDPVLTRGGCLVDTEYSHVDGRVESRISALVAALFGDERGPASESTQESSSDD